MNMNCPPITTSSTSTAAGLNADTRKHLAVQVLAKTEPVSQIAKHNNVSRKFLYKQAAKAEAALNEAFEDKTETDEKVLFYLPVTKSWLRQLVLALLLICRSSIRGVVELLRDLFQVKMSVGTVHNVLHASVDKARSINQAQDLSSIREGAHDELFQAGKPVLVGADLNSTYCYLLSCEDHRDAVTWGVRLLDLEKQGLHPERIIADAGTGLRAGQALAWPDVPCYGDVFHGLQELGRLSLYIERRAIGAMNIREIIEKKMEKAIKKSKGNTLSKKLALARVNEGKYIKLFEDVNTLALWMQKDILCLAGPDYATRKDLYDFVINELTVLEPICEHRIRPVRRSLQNQRDDLLAFAKLLDTRLLEISSQLNAPIEEIRKLVQAHNIDESSPLRWEHEAQVRSQLADSFYPVKKSLLQALADTKRSSSLIENLNSRLRNYFSLRKIIGSDYLELLRFFLNHRTFMRSEHPERVGKSPAELLSGKNHPHWIQMLGYTPFCIEAA
jgi:hypothetical protein